MKILRTILKIASSAKLVDILDENGNGKVEWKEIKNASFNDWVQIIGEIGLTAAAALGWLM